jgi:hypothetical protein
MIVKEVWFLLDFIGDVVSKLAAEVLLSAKKRVNLG